MLVVTQCMIEKTQKICRSIDARALSLAPLSLSRIIYLKNICCLPKKSIDKPFTTHKKIKELMKKISNENWLLVMGSQILLMIL